MARPLLPDTHSVIRIDTAALRHNYQLIRQLAPHAKLLAMVKANAYGHGLVTVARALPEADGFGVACLSEAHALRQAGIAQKIVLMRGIFNHTELAQACALKLDLVIHDRLQAELLLAPAFLKALSQNTLTLWLKIDTGMHRLGFSAPDFKKIFSLLKNHYKNIIILSHFANSEIPDHLSNIKQINLFRKTLQESGADHYPQSLANSGAILNFSQTHLNWIRPGLLLYGVSPLEGKTGPDLGFKPVMTWQSYLLSKKIAKKNSAIGYGYSYICKEDIPIGIVGVGYADGYPRHAQNGTPIRVRDTETQIIGRVSMDMLAVDLRPLASAKTGDPVTLWGENFPIENVARFTATNAYELLCGVKRRV